MKTFGVLAAATLLLVVVGFGTGTFISTDVESKNADLKPLVDTNVSDSLNSTGGCCEDTESVSSKPECDGQCAEGGECCQSGSRASLIATAAKQGQVSDVPVDLGSQDSVTGALAPAIAPVVGPQDEGSASTVITGDWAMWGGSIDRNMVTAATNLNLEFNLKEGDRVNWVANLGSQTYGNAVVAGGKVFVGCNNAGKYRPKYAGEEGKPAPDKGCVLCFDEETGEFLWQLTRDKLTSGRVNDWPYQGICSTPAIELAENEEDGSGRMWVVTNRCELICVDLDGFKNGNDGVVQDEVDSEMQDADILWNLDMIEELGVFPHNLATSSPVIYGDMVYVVTSNGVDEAHLELPSPRAPSFLAVNKNTGEVVWEANQPFDKVLHGQWGSPTVGLVNGKAQVYFPGGDGWVYALDALTGEEIWKFDLNPKNSLWELGGRGTRNAIIATAVFKDNSLLVAVGQDPEHGEGVGHLWRIDATKTGDVSAEIGELGDEGEPNPNTGVIWHYGGTDDSGKRPRSNFRRTMSTVAVADGLVFAVDLSGYVHCIDYETGARYWEEDLLTGVWGSPMIADGKVFLGTEEGTLFVFAADKNEANVIRQYDTINNSSIYSTPTIANGRMFLTDRTRLYSIQIQGEYTEKEVKNKE